MNEVNKEILFRAQTGVSNAITLLIGALRDRETAEAERDSAQKLLLNAIEARDSWASRFRGLEADMRGMESMLGAERARVKVHMDVEAQKDAKLAALQTQHDTLERNNACQADTIKDYQTATRTNALVVAAEARFESMKLERDKAQDELSSAKLGLQAAGDVIADTRARVDELVGEIEGLKKSVATAWTQTTQTPMPAFFKPGAKVYFRAIGSHEVSKREVVFVDLRYVGEGAFDAYYTLSGLGNYKCAEENVFATMEEAFK